MWEKREKGQRVVVVEIQGREEGEEKRVVGDAGDARERAAGGWWLEMLGRLAKREKGRRDVLVITKKRENRKRVVVGEMQGRGRRGRRREREWLVVHGR